MQLENSQKEAKLVIDDLTNNGFSISSINDLTGNLFEYKDALPLLLKWITKIKSPGIAETLVRAVSVPWAKKIAVPVLLEKLKRERESENSSLTWAIGNALYVVSDKSNTEELIGIIKDPVYKRARQMIILKIGMMKIKSAEDILISILDDDDVCGHAIAALGYIGSQKAEPYVKEYLNHNNSWIRKEAKNSLIRIEKARVKQKSIQ